MQTEKKLAITVFSFPPDKGNVETAADLNVFSSIFSVLERADQNHVRKHALEQAEANGVTFEKLQLVYFLMPRDHIPRT
ncbi:hypothetical protein OIU77_017858 [Salix suchowensis]|uniref:CobN/magnesium chelatase domain-containing protein n=1 Tax=Salix suchowensis TaxID=1278906 RepID=A0ABQ8ZQ72_9ROSI|nr:hypothetical protein OIU77_017858 [Salix suchowensis]